MNPGAGDQFYPYGEFAQYPPGWIYPYMLNDRGNFNHSPSASVTNAESLLESSPQFIENSSTLSSSSTSSHPTSSAESKKAQDRWGKEEEKLLVQLWAEKHDQLESRESRKTWAWIAEKISKALGTNKTADKCMRKMKYIIERYKNAKDWNKNQTGGSLRKSVYYDEVDKILGCRDVVTFNHVAEAGISGDSATEVVTESSDINIGEISTSSRPNVSETPAEKRRASKKGKRASKRKAPDNESDEEFKMALKDARQQGEKVTTFLDSLQQTQTQQLAMMSQFMGSIVKILDNQQNEK